MRLIDADKAIEDIVVQFPDAHYPSYYAEIIREQPIIDAKPVIHGRWERHYSRPGVYANLWWWCTACGENTAEKQRFCPNCGAKMEDDNGEM